MNRSIRDLLSLLPAKPATRGRAKACVPRDQTKSGCCNSAHPHCGVKPGNDPELSRVLSIGQQMRRGCRVNHGWINGSVALIGVSTKPGGHAHAMWRQAPAQGFSIDTYRGF
jgi:hypothetical protein